MASNNDDYAPEVETGQDVDMTDSMEDDTSRTLCVGAPNPIQDHGIPSVHIPDQIQDYAAGSVDPEMNVHEGGSVGHARGMLCKKKKIFLGHVGRNYPKRSLPSDLKDYAIIIRYTKSDNPHKEVEMFSVEIQSPLLKAFLHGIFHDYPGVITNLSRLIFYPPFKPFVHRRWRLVQAFKNLHDEETKNHVNLLKSVLLQATKDIINIAEDYTRRQLITWDYIWTIFDPGCLIWATQYCHAVVLRLVKGEFIKAGQDSQVFRLTCVRVDWDGIQFGYGTTFEYIYPFEGTLRIKELLCYPLSVIPLAERAKEHIINRGRKFEKLAGCHHKHYNAKAIDTFAEGKGVSRLVMVNGHIIIDSLEHRNWNRHMPMDLRPLHGARAAANIQVWMRAPTEEIDDSEEWLDDTLEDSGNKRKQEASADARSPLSEEHLLLCSPVVRGHALGPKLWLEFSVNDVADETRDSSPSFYTPILTEPFLLLIIALMEARNKKNKIPDNYVPSRYPGTSILLHGNRGTGKSLTAHWASALLRVPLYKVDIQDVDVDLTKIMGLMSKWNVMLVMFDCHLFLADGAPLRPKALRLLEEYDGIILLTTDRYEGIDGFVKKRIQFSFERPDLDKATRTRAWKWCLEQRQSDHEVSDEEFDHLALLNIDGRVICNIAYGAVEIASQGEQKVNYNMIDRLLRLSGYNMPIMQRSSQE
ncbi:P-loop containing nucleoside triphosphate hydrolase protein [Xylaria sp. FL1042]|nr:P-loop containing nucleoside triphosphate hydrolase protein [Xylaria sp. FL1042]